MATKAEQARAHAQQTARPKHTKKRKKKDTVEPRVHAEAEQLSSGHYAGGVTATRNVELDRGDHQTFDLEDSGTGQASRKSTRKSAHRSKPDAPLHRRAIRRQAAPEARAARGR
jgi:hypothetical protein